MKVVVWPLEQCKDCPGQTLWRCMECDKPCCPSCQFFMHSMCKPCRAAYVGPTWQLGKRSDAYVTAEFARLMPV